MCGSGFSQYVVMSLFNCRRGCGVVILFLCLFFKNVPCLYFSFRISIWIYDFCHCSVDLYCKSKYKCIWLLNRGFKSFFYIYLGIILSRSNQHVVVFRCTHLQHYGCFVLYYVSSIITISFL